MLQAGLQQTLPVQAPWRPASIIEEVFALTCKFQWLVHVLKAVMSN
jgi:hypothetical protein